MSSSDLIGVGPAAVIVDLSERTVKRLAKDGKLPFVHKLEGERGAYVFKRAEVIAFAEARQAERRARVEALEAKLNQAKAAVQS